MQPAGILREQELNEFTMRAPFGGIQSEVSPEVIEATGFYDAVNILFRKARAFTRPGYSSLPVISPLEPIVGVADFFRTTGEREQVIMTPTRLLKWDGGTQDWEQITGTLTGLSTQLFTKAVVGGKLFFCQGTDQVQVWDGAVSSFGPANVSIVPARFLMELGFHLVMASTIEAGVVAPQRVRWSNIGDGTDLTDPTGGGSAGQSDLFNDLGPIANCCKLYQSGFIFQQWGITQMIPTGDAVVPFQFFPLSAHSKGNICPYSLAPFGEMVAPYVGKDNVYVFDSTQSYPIGDSPMDGNRRSGARSRIFADLQACQDLNTVFGFNSTSINGQPFNAYWLTIPGASTWIYNWDEKNWMRQAFNRTPSIAGVFSKQSVVRIMDLIGPISSQSWAPGTLTNANPLDGMFLGFVDGTPGYIDFTGTTETPWNLRSGQLNFGDLRHAKHVEKMRIIYQDLAPVTYTVTLTNEIGISDTRTITVGTGSGSMMTKVQPFNLWGNYFTLLVSGSGGPVGISELTLMYVLGEETKAN